MSSKKEAPPPRPPAPRVSLSKLRGVVSKGGGTGPAVNNVSIRFNPASLDEEDYDLFLEEDSAVVIATEPSVVSPAGFRKQPGDKTIKQPALYDTHKDVDNQASVNTESPNKTAIGASTGTGSPTSSIHQSTTSAASSHIARDTGPKIVVGHVGKINKSNSKSAVVGHVSTSSSSSSSRQGDSGVSSKPLVVTDTASNRGFMKPQKAEITESLVTAEMEKKTSLLADIRGKLSDKFVDPLTAALREKIEELSSESSPEEDRPQKSRETFAKRRVSSLDEQQLKVSVEGKKVLKQGSLDASFFDKLVDEHFGENKLSSTKNGSKSESLISEHSVETDGGKLHTAKLDSNSSFEDIEIASEPFEDFSGALNDPASVHGMKKDVSSSSGLSLANSDCTSKSTNQTSLNNSDGVSSNSQKHKPPPLASSGRLVPSSAVPGNAVPVVSLSSLLSQKDDDDDLVFTPESTGDVNEKFFSPSEIGPEMDGKDEPVKQQPSETEKDKLDNTDKPPSKPTMPPVQRFALLTMSLFVYLVLPLPTYLSGFIMGAALASVGWFSWVWLTAPPPQRPPVVIPELSSLPPLQVPEMKESKIDDGKFKGWVNELDSYDPDDYHINKTHSIYVQLEGTVLRLQRPRQNISKRAMWDDPHFSAQFVHQRHYDLTGSRVYLQPDGLVKKRVWSKKYPICINLAKNASSLSSPRKTSIAEISSVAEEQDSSAKTLGFEVVSKEACQKNTLYIFARTAREKEEWYRRFDAAANGSPLPCRLPSINKTDAKVRHSSSSEFTLHHRRQGSTESTGSTHSEPSRDQPDVTKDNQQFLSEYLKYMGRVMPAESIAKSGNSPFRVNPQISCEHNVVWTNAMIGRLFFDFIHSKYWEEKVSEKIQKKLSKIHVPYFMDELTVTGIDLGSEIPTIRRISRPYLDERGMWIDLDLAYSGGFIMSLETKVNLMKLKKTKPVSKSSDEKRSPVTDSEEEDSAESSTDEEADEKYDENAGEEAGGTSGKGKKIWRIVDKITKSKYFQQATEYKYIKKAMEEVSNTRLMLTVAVQSLVGTLAINIPPPPTDRIWYGFRTNPRLWLSAKPKVGEREVTVTHVTDWIEKKLAIEFQRIVVMPNMDDVPIPLMLTQLNDTRQPSASS